ncbi:hypothetical protein FIBSPDRAFT_899120 [Athelia psychrophila]|uniref:Uncharacterized protein n=1 Tax=Athelia psychrophila TaxID=1759441 RepID=A0A166A3Q7_9AGAM|nr:hypothetical protein FIBSPDRAFT_899120 [Fibularhizoctonia sp. CBS 109695]
MDSRFFGNDGRRWVELGIVLPSSDYAAFESASDSQDREAACYTPGMRDWTTKHRLELGITSPELRCVRDLCASDLTHDRPVTGYWLLMVYMTRDEIRRGCMLNSHPVIEFAVCSVTGRVGRGGPWIGLYSAWAQQLYSSINSTSTKTKANHQGQRTKTEIRRR